MGRQAATDHQLLAADMCGVRWEDQHQATTRGAEVKRDCVLYRCDFCGAEEQVNKSAFGGPPESVPDGWIEVIIPTSFEELRKHLCAKCRKNVMAL